MIVVPNKFRLVVVLLLLGIISHAQDISWMRGSWKETGEKNHFIKTILIDSVYGNYFSGTRTIEINDRSHSKIITSLSGYLAGGKFSMDDNKVLYEKEPINGAWLKDCDSCPVETRLTFAGDSIFINRRVLGCREGCDGMSNYYRLLCDFDTSTQRYLVTVFGTLTDSRSFHPCIKKLPTPVADKRKKDSIQNAQHVAKLKQQHIEDSLNKATIIAEKKRQHIEDSLNAAATIAKKKQQQQTEDSIKSAKIIAKKKLQDTQDSLKNVAVLEKDRQRHAEDSLKKVLEHARNNSVEKKPAMPGAVTQKNPDDKAKVLEQRDNLLLQTYHIKTPVILIELFDNAQVDGDRVSVYHNNNLIVDNNVLQKEPITLTIHADANSRMHEFTLVAENLGTIPPNTASMRITADDQVYKLAVTTDLKTNAKIVFYYDGN